MIRLFGKSQIMANDERLTVVRKGVVYYKDGKPVERDGHDFTIIANVQPVGGRDLMMLPEHDRLRENFWLFMDNKQFCTSNEWSVSGPSLLYIGDKVVRLDANYTVQEVRNWGSYIQARICRIDVGPDATPGRA